MRAADPNHLIFREPTIFASGGAPNYVGAMNYPSLVLNFHDYCSFRSGVTGNPTNLSACVAQEESTFVRRSAEGPLVATPARAARTALVHVRVRSDAEHGAAPEPDQGGRPVAHRMGVLVVEVLRRPHRKLGRGAGEPLWTAASDRQCAVPALPPGCGGILDADRLRRRVRSAST